MRDVKPAPRTVDAVEDRSVVVDLDDPDASLALPAAVGARFGTDEPGGKAIAKTDDTQDAVLEMIEEASDTTIEGMNTAERFRIRADRERAVLALAEAYALLEA